MTPHLRIVGAGWAGLAAAVAACQKGWRVSLYEASAHAGGRARALPRSPEGLRLDNGQHILIQAYAATRALMHTVGVSERDTLLRLPLQLQDARGQGLALPDWPAPWNLLWGL